MRTKLINDGSEKTYALILETGEEVVSQLQRFIKENDLAASRFTAIGAFSSATLAYFNWDQKDYEKIAVNEQVEVLSLIGDVAKQDGESKSHIHVVVGKRDGSAHGGHLLQAYVRPTLEIILTESPAYLKRSFDAESGLALIDIG
ncbi:PPC domain-containing DNA-binding protein [Herminiimonas sp. NPDC097707]|uniref:PPC domain-containing DNA-binding protein n=1 Tax=Herminiimonas sp. NPDC097707 TaxID=3364007 RepID=UPI00383A639E